MNQSELGTSWVDQQNKFGIEIEMKLRGFSNKREAGTEAQQIVKPHSQFIELGEDFSGNTAELRTKKGGFTLNKDNINKIYEIVNNYNASEDLVAYLSQHIHLDKNQDYNDTNLLNFKLNTLGTLENKTLSLNTIELSDDYGDLHYSFQVPPLIDQMIIEDNLKEAKPSNSAIQNAYELNLEHGLDLDKGLLLSSVIESGQGYLVPNILRLIKNNKADLKNNYFPVSGGNMLDKLTNGEIIMKVLKNMPYQNLDQFLANEAICAQIYSKAIKANHLDSVYFLNFNTPRKLIPSIIKRDISEGNNAIRFASKAKDKYILSSLLNLLPENERYSELFEKTNNKGENAFFLSTQNPNPQVNEQIRKELDKGDLKKEILKKNTEGYNILRNTVAERDLETFKEYICLFEDYELNDVLFDRNTKNDDTIFHIAARNGDIDILKFIFTKVDEDFKSKALLCLNNRKDNPLMAAIINSQDEMVKFLINELSEKDLKTALTQKNIVEYTPTILAAKEASLDINKLLIGKIKKLKLENEFMHISSLKNINALMGATEQDDDTIFLEYLNNIPDASLSTALKPRSAFNNNNCIELAMRFLGTECHEKLLERIIDNEQENLLLEKNKKNLNTVGSLIAYDKYSEANKIINKLIDKDSVIPLSLIKQSLIDETVPYIASEDIKYHHLKKYNKEIGKMVAKISSYLNN